MKKGLLLATAAFLITGASFAEGGKDKKKEKKSGKTCCSKPGKSCGKSKTTASI